MKRDHRDSGPGSTSAVFVRDTSAKFAQKLKGAGSAASAGALWSCVGLKLRNGASCHILRRSILYPGPDCRSRFGPLLVLCKNRYKTEDEYVAISIYKLKLNASAHAQSTRKSSGPVAKLSGVTARAVRDVWNRKTWPLATRHLWPLRGVYFALLRIAKIDHGGMYSSLNYSHVLF